MTEVWRDVSGFEGLYQVSDRGRVRNLRTGRLLSPDNVRGYLRYTLSKGGYIERRRAHRLVAEAFVPNPENKPQVNHINGDKADNRPANLEWCTGSENQTHSRHVLGNHCGLPKKRVKCTETGKTYPSVTAAAQACGVSLSQLSRVLNGQQRQTHKLHFNFMED